MTKKDFIVIADTLNLIFKSQAWKKEFEDRQNSNAKSFTENFIVSAFVGSLSRVNYRFDSEKFAGRAFNGVNEVEEK